MVGIYYLDLFNVFLSIIVLEAAVWVLRQIVSISVKFSIFTECY